MSAPPCVFRPWSLSQRACRRQGRREVPAQPLKSSRAVALARAWSSHSRLYGSRGRLVPALAQPTRDPAGKQQLGRLPNCHANGGAKFRCKMPRHRLATLLGQQQEQQKGKACLCHRHHR